MQICISLYLADLFQKFLASAAPTHYQMLPWFAILEPRTLMQASILLTYINLCFFMEPWYFQVILSALSPHFAPTAKLVWDFEASGSYAIVLSFEILKRYVNVCVFVVSDLFWKFSALSTPTLYQPLPWFGILEPLVLMQDFSVFTFYKGMLTQKLSTPSALTHYQALLWFEILEPPATEGCIRPKSVRLTFGLIFNLYNTLFTTYVHIVFVFYKFAYKSKVFWSKVEFCWQFLWQLCSNV